VHPGDYETSDHCGDPRGRVWRDGSRSVHQSTRRHLEVEVEKSKAPFKSGSTTIEAAGEGIKFAVDLVGTDGTKSHWEFTANYDGKEVPITGSSPYGDTVSVKRVDARTIVTTAKYKGKVTTTHTIVVSPDGKTRTATAKGTDIKGQPVDSVSFYEKQ